MHDLERVVGVVHVQLAKPLLGDRLAVGAVDGRDEDQTLLVVSILLANQRHEVLVDITRVHIELALFLIVHHRRIVLLASWVGGPSGGVRRVDLVVALELVLRVEQNVLVLIIDRDPVHLVVPVEPVRLEHLDVRPYIGILRFQRDAQRRVERVVRVEQLHGV